MKHSKRILIKRIIYDYSKYKFKYLLTKDPGEIS